MKVEFSETLKAKDHSLVVIPFYEEKDKAKEISSHKELKSLYASSLKIGDFKGKKSQTHFIYPENGIKRVLLLGLGNKSKDLDKHLDSLRASFSSAIKEIRKRKISEAVFVLSSFKTEEVEAIFDGILSMNYSFNFYKKEDPLLDKMSFIGADYKSCFEKKQKIFSGIYLARDLVNDNADKVTPLYLAKTAKDLEKKSSKVKVKILDKKQIEKEKMGLLLAVNRASSIEPRLILIDYEGGKKGEKPIVIVGKGVTYDTGGLSLKPTASMLDMKADMGGAGAVLGTMEAIIGLGIKKNVIGVIPATENGIDGMSYKPGDVYTSLSGKTVEVNNTDAEGRLILADAIEYVNKYLKPSCIVDLATLTGGILVALGDEITGLFTDDKSLLEQFQKASENTGELVWHMPMHKAYRSMLDSVTADIVNSAGRNASSVTAALFLKEFIGKTPWVHLDIAGPAFYEKPKGICPSQATGVGVRLLIEFIENYGNKDK